MTTVSEAAHPGMKNEEFAKLSIQLIMVIISRDADFIRLKQPLMRQLRVVYIGLSGDPDSIAQNVLKNIDRSISLLYRHTMAIVDEEGCHAP